jgi:hypothetical protein
MLRHFMLAEAAAVPTTALGEITLGEVALGDVMHARRGASFASQPRDTPAMEKLYRCPGVP